MRGCNLGTGPCRRPRGGSRQRPWRAALPRAADAGTLAHGARSSRNPRRRARSRAPPPAPHPTGRLQTIHIHNTVTSYPNTFLVTCLKTAYIENNLPTDLIDYALHYEYQAVVLLIVIIIHNFNVIVIYYLCLI